MYQRHLTNITRSSQYNLDRSAFLRLDANERVLPFEKKTLNDLKRIITNDYYYSWHAP